MEDESARLHAFQTLLDGSEHASEPRVEMTALRNLCARGIPAHPPHLRPLAWSLLLEVLPAEKKQWRQAEQTSRTRYYALVKILMDDLDKLESPASQAAPCDLLLTQLNKDLERSFSSSSFFKSRTNPSRASPLAPPGNATASESDDEDAGESSTAILNRRAAFRRLEMIAEAEHRRSHTPVVDRKGKGRELAPPMELEIQSTQRRIKAMEFTAEPVLSPRITLSASGSRASSPPISDDTPPLTTPQLSLSIPSVQSSPTAQSKSNKAPSPITLLSPKPLPTYKLPFQADSPALPGSVLQPDTHAESILRILYVFVKAHPQWEYTQGFADVLIPLYMVYAIGGDGEPELQRRKKDKRQPKARPSDALPTLALFSSWGRHAEEETFWAFAALMGELGGVIAGPPKSRDWAQGTEVDGVKAALEKLGRRVRWADEELWTSLQTRNLDPTTPYYSYRYVALLLSRDLPRQALLPAWDFMLSQANTTSDRSPKLDLLVDICTAMLLLLKSRLLANPRKASATRKVAPTGFWGVTEESEADVLDQLDTDDPDALGEAFARGMRLLQDYPLAFVGGIEAVLDVTFRLQQARLLALDTKDDPDGTAWIEAKSAQDSRASWTSSVAVRKAANLASSRIWGNSVTQQATSTVSTGPSLFSKYASALQNSEAAANVARTSQSWGASALAKWNSSTAPATVPSTEQQAASWGSLGSAAGRLLGTAATTQPEDPLEDKYTAVPTSPPTPRRHRRGSSQATQDSSFSGMTGSPSYLESLSSLASRPRSDSNSSVRSSVSLQDRLAGLATALNPALNSTSSQQPTLASSSPSGPKPLLLSGSARRASNTVSTPASLSRSSAYKRASLVNQESPIGRSPLSPPASAEIETETEGHRVIPIGRSRNVTPSTRTPEGHLSRSESPSLGAVDGVTAAALRLRDATDTSQPTSPSLPRSQRQGGLSERAGKTRLIGRRALVRPRPMSSSSMDSCTAPSTPGGSSPNEDDTLHAAPRAIHDLADSALLVGSKQDEDDNAEHMQWIANGIHGSVFRLRDGTRVVKVVDTASEQSMRPHDVRREIRVLARTFHPAIIQFYGSREDRQTFKIKLYLPFYPTTLTNVIAHPAFTPFSTAASEASFTNSADFHTITTSWTFQLLLGLAHLHSSDPMIAHRDIKPANIMLTSEGSLKLIDFATAYEGDQSNAENNAQVCEVGSGPYRAPELLFGPHKYDPKSLDLWSAGTCVAEMFTPFRWCTPSTIAAIEVARLSTEANLDPTVQYESDDSDSSSEPAPPTGLVNRTWKRMTLFNGDRGDLGLAWSIFQILGTPSEATWSSFERLPDATKIQYSATAPTDLRRLLPFATPHMVPLLSRLLSLDPMRRLSAADALQAILEEDVVLPMPLWREEAIFYGEREKRVTLSHSNFRADEEGLFASFLSQLR